MEEGENVMVDHRFDNSGIAPSMSVHMPPILARQDPLTTIGTGEKMRIAQLAANEACYWKVKDIISSLGQNNSQYVEHQYNTNCYSAWSTHKKCFLSYHLLIILDPSFQLLQFQLYEYYTC